MAFSMVSTSAPAAVYGQTEQLKGGVSGKCSTPTQLLICSSFSRENGHLLLICSSLSTTQVYLQIGFNKKNNPICSMYGIFTYIWLEFMVDVGKYTIHTGGEIHSLTTTVGWNIGPVA